MTVNGRAFASDGYQQTEKAYVLHRTGEGGLDLSLQASGSSPLVNPALVIRNWGDAQPRLIVNGRPAARGSVRFGSVPRLDGTDLLVWIRLETSTPVTIQVAPVQ